MNDCCKKYQDKIADACLFMLQESKTGNLTESDKKALELCSKILIKNVLEICFNCRRPLTRLDNNELICLGCHRESPLE